MRIKNWENRQSFRKDRPPSWIRLYFDLLDNFEWHSLPPEHAKMLIELWLLAAQHDPQHGGLPSIEKIAFLLRRDLTETKRIVESLCGEWVTIENKEGLHDGIQTVTKRLPDGSTEIEIEIEIENRRDNTTLSENEPVKKKRAPRKKSKPLERSEAFNRFWEAYPRKSWMLNAHRVWIDKCLDDSIDMILSNLERQKASHDWRKDGGKWIPGPTKWLEGEGWNNQTQIQIEQDEEQRKIDADIEGLY